MPFKAKTDSEGNLVFENENIVLLNEKDEEVVFLAPQNLSGLHAESAKHRKEAKEAKAALAKFEGVDLDEVKELKAFRDNNKDAKEQIEQIKNQITETFSEKIAEKDKTLSEKDAVIRKLAITSKFSGSEFITKNTVLPAEIAEAYFGANFEVKEDGSIVAKLNGNELYSKKRPGELATFDEAIEMIVDQSPYKDTIARDPGHTGTGARFGDRSTGGGGAVNPWKAETRNLTLQSKIAAENSTLATKMKAEAGMKAATV